MNTHLAPALTPEQRTKAIKIVGLIAGLLVIVSAGLLLQKLLDREATLFDLVFPLGIVLSAYFVWQLRQRLHPENSADATSSTDASVRTSAPARFKRIKIASVLFGVLMISAFLIDMWYPDVSNRLMNAAASPISDELKATQPPARIVNFDLPESLFNGQRMAMDVSVSGKGSLNGDILTLDFAQLSIVDRLSASSTYRLKAEKIIITATEDAGEHARSVGESAEIRLPPVDQQRRFLLTDLHTEIKLAARADLSKIWLRIELWHGDSYSPIDGTPGQLNKLLAQAEPQLNACNNVSAWRISPRKAIAQGCNAQLVSALHHPLWLLVEKFNALRGEDPLMMVAYYQSNLPAIKLLHQNGVAVDARDSTDRTALMMASWQRRNDFVQALLDAGAQPEIETAKDNHSAISGAMFDGYADTVALLLRDLRWLDTKETTLGYHPSHLLVYRGHVAMLAMLLERGMNPNIVNRASNGRGETLLMAATRSQHNSQAIIKLLLAHHANLNLLDAHGKNATDWAEFFGNKEASDLLCSQGLEPTPLDAGGSNNEVRKRASCADASAVAASATKAASATEVSK